MPLTAPRTLFVYWGRRGSTALTLELARAIEGVLAEQKLRTRDLGGAANTVDCGKAVAARLA